MGYAMLSREKLVCQSMVDSMQQAQLALSNTQFSLTSSKSGLQSQLSALTQANAQEKADLYEQLADDSDMKDEIETEIKQLDEELKAQTEAINREVQQVGIKEAAIELEIKSVDTALTVYQQRLEAVQDAEGKGIDGATPKFSGVG